MTTQPSITTVSDDTTATLAAAQEYTARGWPVFPVHSVVAGHCTCGKGNCGSAGKHPTTPSGLKDANTDPRRFNWTRRNVAIRTGNGLLVIDVDSKHGAKLERLDGGSWLLIDGDGNHVAELPASRVHGTGGGGWHWFGTVTETIRNTASKLGPGIDTRGDGGYVLAPPSHHASGGSYAVLEAGDLADVPGDLVELLRAKPTTSRPTTVARPTRIPTGYGGKALRAECDRVRTAPGGTGHATLYDAALKLGSLVGGGALSYAETRAELLAADRNRNSASSPNGQRPEEEALRTIDDGLTKGMESPRYPRERNDHGGDAEPEGLEEFLAKGDTPDTEDSPGEDGRKRLLLSVGHKNNILRRVARELRSRIYLRGDVPVVMTRLADDQAHRGIMYHRGGCILRMASSHIVQFQVDQKFACKRINRHGIEEATAFAKGWSDQFVANAPELPLLPLDGIVKAPLFNIQTGAVLAAPGYDKASRLYVDFYGSLPTITEKPTKAECEDALRYLLRPWRGYIETFGVDAVAIAGAVLTAAIRPTLPTAPGIILNGNVPGCGKGLFGDCLGILATGARPATINEGASEEETEKRVTSAIISGAPAVMLDNLQRPLACSALESGLTNPVATIRRFGTLDSLEVPWRALVIVTANNPSIRRDNIRRFVPLRIVARDASPESIKFDFDPRVEVARDRAELLAAAFTVLRGRIANPGPTDTLGSFTEWADLVSGAVHWLMGRSVVSLIQERKGDDPMLHEQEALLGALRERFGDKPFSSKEAAMVGKLEDHWAAVLPEGKKPGPVTVGIWLNQHDRTPVGSLRVEYTGQKNAARSKLWRVVELEKP